MEGDKDVVRTLGWCTGSGEGGTLALLGAAEGLAVVGQPSRRVGMFVRRDGFTFNYGDQLHRGTDPLSGNGGRAVLRGTGDGSRGVSCTSSLSTQLLLHAGERLGVGAASLRLSETALWWSPKEGDISKSDGRKVHRLVPKCAEHVHSPNE